MEITGGVYNSDHLCKHIHEGHAHIEVTGRGGHRSNKPYERKLCGDTILINNNTKNR